MGKYPNNWIVTGLMLYFAGAFFLFLLANYTLAGANRHARNIIWDAHATLVLIMYLLMAVGFMKCKK